jgi:cyclopropane fatty-acyl-phospholipid synthase-like methyltransferase
MDFKKALQEHFPLSQKYNKEWVTKHSMGENVLYNLESLTEVLKLTPGMKVLDLACGKAISSIFLAETFGVHVWAVDNAIEATDNWKRVQEAGCSDLVFPLKADARQLPFPYDYFDAVIVIDSYTYFGTDDKYLAYIMQFIKEGGHLGIVDVCFTKEIDTFAQVPEFLKEDYQLFWYFIHSIDWWQKLWEKTGLVKVTVNEHLPHAGLISKAYIKDYEDKQQEPFAKALRNDDTDLITMFRLVARKNKKEVYLQDYNKEKKH